MPPNWLGADPCGSNWEGIRCSNSRVISMDLSNNIGLKGTLPSSIGNLKNLTTFFFGQIPDSIGSLQQLVFIHLSQNQLSGTIPPKLFSPNMKLIHVRLDSNTLNGSVPDNLNNLTSLNEL
nr:probable leucine-rich repeat receptor-like protein kinase At5g49770 [Ipomoea batatas]